MAIAPIGATSLAGITPLSPDRTTGIEHTAAADGKFGNTLSGALDNLEAAQDNADTLAVQAATGDLVDVHNYAIAATEASLMTQLTVAVRDRAVESFNEIMRMQL
jgi:flagellar hook-basal body complex protein FliE